MEVQIIVKTEVRCPLVKFPILLSLCRGCENYRYETVDGKVMCNYTPIPRRGIPREVQP